MKNRLGYLLEHKLDEKYTNEKIISTLREINLAYEFEEGYIPLTKMPLFDSEEEFYYCLAEGNKDIYRIERLNKKKFKDKNGKYIKVRNINELKRYKNKFLSSIYSIISYMLGVALGVLLVKFIIISLELI